MAGLNNMSIVIGGDAGQGVESTGGGFALALARAGLHLFATQDYRSQIRGGHNFYTIRIGGAGRFPRSQRQHHELVVALTPETVDLHLADLSPGGGVIFDEAATVDEQGIGDRGARAFPVPLARLARRVGGSLVTMNTAALGAVAGLTGFPLDAMEAVIRENFASKGPEIIESNLAVLHAAHEETRTRFPEAFDHQLAALADEPRQLLLSGNQALAYGALLGGCRFVAAYPMTPATTILEWLTAVDPTLGVVTKHTEDELSAIAMAIGAGYAGARSMTATSGGGFALMAEAIGFAGMVEAPVVVVNVQRGGPSTGLPTRTEQPDLLFAINIGHGEFPRIVIAPGSIEQCFEAGWRALNLAARYQCPVIVLSDQFLASALRTHPAQALDRASVEIDRGEIVTSWDPDVAGLFERFAFTPSGVSPRAFPGTPGAVHSVTSDEHTTGGHISEQAEDRVPMMEKRMRKLETAASEMRPPRLVGPSDADVTFVCWGSTYMICREAVSLAAERGLSANVLQFTDLWPFPPGAADLLRALRRPLLVEQNFTGQLGKLIRQETGISIEEQLRKYDGRPFSPDEVLDAAFGGVATR